MPDTAAVQDALARIEASGAFAHSPRMSRFLRFVVEETVAGRAADLKEYVVGVHVFDKAESYDPAVDPTVRVEASKLRARLARYYETEGRRDAFVIDIPKGHYRAAFAIRQESSEPTSADMPPEASDHPEAKVEKVSGASVGKSRASTTSLIGIAAVALLAGLSTILIWRPWQGGPLLIVGSRLVADFPGSAGGASFSPDGTMVAYHDATGVFQICVRPVAGGTPIQLTSDSVNSSFPSWSPKGEMILFNQRNDVWSVSPLGGPPRRFIEQGLNPGFSSSGTLIVFEGVAFDRGIYVVDGQGAGRRRVAERTAYGAARPALSPDGRQIAFLRYDAPPSADLWIVPVAGGEPRRLTFDRTSIGRPAWMPDGKTLLFHSARGGSETLWRLPVEGGQPVPVTTGSGQDRDPAVTADGRHIIYTNARFSRAIVLLDPVTGHQTDVITRRAHRANVNAADPRFSPDGRRIAFASDVDGKFQLFTIRPDGQDLRQVTHGPGQSFAPRWSRDGTSLYFSADHAGVRTFRKVSIEGGAAVEVGPWPADSGVEVDPTDQRIVYSQVKDALPEATFVRHLASGEETRLSLPLAQFRWLPDGDGIVGTHFEGLAPFRRRVVVCNAISGSCRTVTDGRSAVPSRERGRMLFRRDAHQPGTPPPLLTIGLDGSTETALPTVRSEGLLFDVSPGGQIVFVEFRAGRAELWHADVGVQ